MSRESFIAALDVLTGTTTKQVNKRGCELCANEKSVGKYFVSKEDNPDACGWWRVCSDCSSMVSNVGANVEYYKYSKEHKEAGVSNLPEHILKCVHEWDKHSLVGELCRKNNAIFDWMKCTECGCFGKRFGLGQHGVVDLSVEIDLSCSR